MNAVNFPDTAFMEYVSQNFDSDSDGILTNDEISVVTEINFYSKDISYLRGI